MNWLVKIKMRRLGLPKSILLLIIVVSEDGKGN